MRRVHDTRRRSGIQAQAGAEEGVGAPELCPVGAGECRSTERTPGRLRPEDPGMVGRRRIYDRVRTDGKGGGTPLTHLRRRGRKPNRQGGRHAGRGHVPGRRDIPERPETVGGKVRVGDREADTVTGGLTERGRRWSERR